MRAEMMTKKASRYPGSVMVIFALPAAIWAGPVQLWGIQASEITCHTHDPGESRQAQSPSDGALSAVGVSANSGQRGQTTLG
jgi:hypothetical protein